MENELPSASIIDPERVRLYKNPTKSEVSTVISVSPTQAANLSFPPEPKVGRNDHFECPYCFILCPVKKRVESTGDESKERSIYHMYNQFSQNSRHHVI